MDITGINQNHLKFIEFPGYFKDDFGLQRILKSLTDPRESVVTLTTGENRSDTADLDAALGLAESFGAETSRPANVYDNKDSKSSLTSSFLNSSDILISITRTRCKATNKIISISAQFEGLVVKKLGFREPFGFTTTEEGRPALQQDSIKVFHDSFASLSAGEIMSFDFLNASQLDEQRQLTIPPSLIRLPFPCEYTGFKENPALQLQNANSKSSSNAKAILLNHDEPIPQKYIGLSAEEIMKGRDYFNHLGNPRKAKNISVNTPQITAPSHLFTGITPTTTRSFQLLHIVDPFFHKHIYSVVYARAVCDAKDGWYMEGHLGSLRDAIKKKIAKEITVGKEDVDRDGSEMDAEEGEADDGDGEDEYFELLEEDSEDD